MAVTVTDNRSTLYQDGLTNITGASTSETGFFAEATGCAAEAYNETTGQIYWSGTTPNFTTTGNELIYVWSAIVATQNGYKEVTPTDSSHAMYLSDGTNDLLIYQAGNDRAVFKHSDTQVSFECFLVDIDYLSTMNTNGDLAVTAGTFASFDSTSTTMDVGAHYTTLSKALGGGNNCYLDIIRYGGQTDGIQVAGGTTGDRGTFSEVAAEDRSTTDGKAHGIIREYTAGAYGVQGTLRLGDLVTGTSYFESTNESLTFEDRLVSDDKFALYTDANATGTNVVILTNSVITSARPGVTVDFSAANMNELTLTGCTFSGMRRTVSFPTDANGTTRIHEVSTTTFNDCDQIDPGNTTFSDCTIQNYDSTIASATGSGNGAVLLDADGSAKWSGLNFVSRGTGHAIYITATGTYDFTDFSYTGYASVDGSTGNEVVYNNSGGDVTINVVGGDNPTVRNGANANTVVNNNISINVTNLKDNTEVRVYETSTIDNTPPYTAPTEIAGIENATTGTTDNRSFSFGLAAGTGITIRTFNKDWIAADVVITPSSSQDVQISQRQDRVYSNP